MDHKVLAEHAERQVNVLGEEAKERRRQVNYLRDGLTSYIHDHPDYDLVKLRASGSTAKHTAIRRHRGEGSDADVAAYVRTNDLDVAEAGLLEWLCERCIGVYGKTKVADDFVISDHAVGITLRHSGLKIDVAPVLYTGEPDDKGYLITRQGDRVLTSVTQHLQFIRLRKEKAGPGYRELIRLLKAWIRESKRQDPDLRCKSFLIELIVAHLWDNGWNGEMLQVEDYPRAFEQVLAYIVRTGLTSPIVFDDFYDSADVAASTDPIQVWDPVNPTNNVARSYADHHRIRLVDRAAASLDEISWAATAPGAGAVNEAWRTLFGPSFAGA
ncbi:CBASS oligonucleotide cyclase [Sphaerisporangium sp. NPDC051017]|uniref:CBASS oligonucleotide cyclase n=1 Tax=Sphaerisporangium sp. NPDC051017 TaxID=3154636 RepID=UPI00341FEB53